VSQFMRYTCNAGVLPVIKAALMAKGYTLADPQRAQSRGATAVVLLRGTTAVLLAQPPNNAVAEIEIWGSAQSAVAAVFEALQIELHRLPPRSSATR
jgi:hypothetical protein